MDVVGVIIAVLIAIDGYGSCQVRQMLKALSMESGIQIPDESLEDIIDKVWH